MNKNKKYILIVVFFIISILLILIISFCFSVRSNIKDSALAQVIINDKIIYVEVPQTQSDRIKGLGSRETLAEDQGMLFVFEKKQKPGFVMRQMQFPLDFIWINDNQIVEITKNVTIPLDNQDLTVYYPQAEVNYVLEVNAGYCEKNNFQVGDWVEILANLD